MDTKKAEARNTEDAKSAVQKFFDVEYGKPSNEGYDMYDLLDFADKYASLREAQAVEKLEKENFHLAANQCNQPIAGEGGNMECGAINQAVADYKERVKAEVKEHLDWGKIEWAELNRILDTTN
jgi:hypothetical protein